MVDGVSIHVPDVLDGPGFLALPGGAPVMPRPHGAGLDHRVLPVDVLLLYHVDDPVPDHLEAGDGVKVGADQES